MILISADSELTAEAIAKQYNLHKDAYIYLPTTNPKERKDRLRGLYGFTKNQLVGNFSYLEIERVTRQIGVSK